jgi:hypothetical protein
LVFPSSASILKEIPLFLKFTCVEYSMNSLMRGGNTFRYSGNAGGGNVKAYINVPVPSKMVTQTAMRYKQDDNELFSKSGIQQALEQDFLPKIIQKTVGGYAKDLVDWLPFVSPKWKAILLDSVNRTGRSFSQLIETDFTETILQSGSKRSFVISLYLPCLNLEDSEAAAQISRAFEALALPTMVKAAVPGFDALGAQLHFHPPMWFFSIGAMGSDSDIDWTSQPQASVLTNVAVTRTPIDSTAFTALDLTIKPIGYSITLNFQEIETAFRRVSPLAGSGTDFTILSRSAANFGAAASLEINPKKSGGENPSGGRTSSPGI